MFKRYLAAVGIWLVCWPLAGWGADAPQLLQQFIRNVTSATGEFSQVTVSETGQAQGTSQTGTFAFQRPGKFKWHVQQPYEQLTISDGQHVYQYDPDLAQVIVRDVDDSVGASPAAILFGSGELDEAFTITTASEEDGLKWLRAQPRSPDAGFAYVDIGFQEVMPVRLLLRDSFGQTSRIDLNNTQANPDLAPDVFSFSPPDDVDVVKM